MFLLASLLISLVAQCAFAQLEKKSSIAITAVTSSQWKALNESVGGRLSKSYPLAKPCYSLYNGQLQTPDTAQCSAIQNGYLDEVYIANQHAGYMNTNWGFCQASGQDCGLDFNLPSDPVYYAPPMNCHQGSVPAYYINVKKVSDIQAALKFVHEHSIPLNIKNSGHDYKGRSSAPNSLSLWTHNIQPRMKLLNNFRPAGCSEPSGKNAVTIGAGEGFAGVYSFAEANNVTVVGGSARTVGISGGWIAGGGHGSLSNTLGLGVDNVLQMKAVLPNGTLVTANRCQNQDIFFALRGGGGSTFGVNWEITTTAHPQLELQVAYIRFLSTSLGSANKFLELTVQQANKWASQGWGGYIAPGAQSKQASGMILFTPSLTHAEAVKSMKPITDYVASLGNVVLNNSIDTSPSFTQAYNKYILPNEEKVGLGLAVGSRLLTTKYFTKKNQKKTIVALEKVLSMVAPPSAQNADLNSLVYGAPLQFLVTAPSSYPDNDTVPASITPAWRDAVWHVVLGQGAANNANAAAFNKIFKTAHDAAQVLRDLAPDTGAYQNEADVFEPQPVESYWGQENYDKLLALKKEIDPSNILTCWDCIGWDKSDKRYQCYPDTPS